MEIQINSALQSLRLLRNNVSAIFETTLTTESSRNKDEPLFLMELQESLSSIDSNYKSLESSISSMQTPSGPFNLGNTSLLNHETDLELQNAYSELVNGHKWFEKIHVYSAHANSMLANNSLKRSLYTLSNKRRLITQPAHYAPPRHVESIISATVVPNMSMKIYRPFATNAFLHIDLGRVLKAAIVLRGLMIEWVTVKGLNEALDNVADHWVESRYAVFRMIQDHAHCAMLHFYSPSFPELAIRSFITWFGSYIKLFTEPCKRCGKFLLNNLPPTFRDVRTLEPFHEECRH